MGLIDRIVSTVFPGIASYEKKIEKVVDDFSRKTDRLINGLSEDTSRILSDYKSLYGCIAGIPTFVNANRELIIDDAFSYSRRLVKDYFNGGRSSRPGTRSAAPPNQDAASQSAYENPAKCKSNKAYESADSCLKTARPKKSQVKLLPAKPVTAPAVQSDKYKGIEQVLAGVGDQLSKYNSKFTLKVEYFEEDGKGRAYTLSSLDSIVANALSGDAVQHPKEAKNIIDESNSYLKRANYVANLYNSGYTTSEIRREAGKKGSSVKSYTDVVDLVCHSIANGGRYERAVYNHEISSRLGAEKEILKVYSQGGSYAEMRKKLAEIAPGMGISNSTIKRLAKKNRVSRKELARKRAV
jgi:hypothetical protein